MLSRKFSIPPQYGVGLAAVLILLMIGTGWAQTGAGQPPEVPPQTPGAPAPAFGQDQALDTAQLRVERARSAGHGDVVSTRAKS